MILLLEPYVGTRNEVSSVPNSVKNFIIDDKEDKGVILASL